MTMKHALWPTIGGLVLGATVLASPAAADEWDQGSDPDRDALTDNVLFHGSEQTHDLGVQIGFVPDQDWYLVSLRPFSSYQFVLDAFTGDLDLTSGGLQRLNGTQVLQQSADVLEAGGVLSMSWRTGAGTSDETNFVRVSGAACTQSCNNLDTYRARFYDTTYTVPRFNNSGTQTTVLLLQNATDRSCTLGLNFMDSSGAPISAATVGVAAHGLFVFSTAQVVPNLSGSVRIAHTCGYGGLSGKAVAIEPSTGFTFDTPVLHRPH
jgi:hypothetical protein